MGTDADKKKIYFIIIITLFCSILEIFAITNLYNFLNLTANQDIGFKSKAIYNFMNLDESNIYYFTLISFFTFIILSHLFLEFY